MEIFWENGRDISPLLTLPALRFHSIEEFREVALKAASSTRVPTHSFTIKTEATGAVERWFRINGAWRRKAV